MGDFYLVTASVTAVATGDYQVVVALLGFNQRGFGLVFFAGHGFT